MKAVDCNLGRRRVLAGAAAGIAGLALMPAALVSAGGPATPIRLALQGYCLKELNLEELLEAAQAMGVRHLELFDRQWSVFLGEAERRRVRGLIDDAGIQVPATYTEYFLPERARNGPILDFGEAMGLEFFSCRPTEETLNLLNEQVADRGVGIALHNTSPGADQAFVTLAEVEQALDRWSHIDACVDVGNFARAGVEPVAALRRLRGRIREVHIKDVAVTGATAPLGEGVLDLAGIVRELRTSEFKGLLTLEQTGGADALAQRQEELAESFRQLRQWTRLEG